MQQFRENTMLEDQDHQGATAKGPAFLIRVSLPPATDPVLEPVSEVMIVELFFFGRTRWKGAMAGRNCLRFRLELRKDGAGLEIKEEALTELSG